MSKRKKITSIFGGIFLLVFSFISRADAITINLGTASEFAILGLENGSVIINSATSIIGNVGYSDGVTSTDNKKVDLFTGAALVHSGATFSYTAATFAPSGGILTGGSVDAKLDQANIDALNASAQIASLSPSQVLGILGDNDSRVINSTGDYNIISLTSLDFNSDYLELVSRPGFDDVFAFNVDGNFAFSQSEIRLTGTSAEHVIFNFSNASDIKINKENTIFFGTILAPWAVIEYHNPAIFEGAIIGSDITLHSDFNITHRSFHPDAPVPEPATLSLLGAGLVGLVFKRKKTS